MFTFEACHEKYFEFRDGLGAKKAHWVSDRTIHGGCPVGSRSMKTSENVMNALHYCPGSGHVLPSHEPGLEVSQVFTGEQSDHSIAVGRTGFALTDALILSE